MEKDNKANGKLAKPSFTKEELMERAYKQKWREFKIARTRASVLRNQITEAYTILENIRFDYLGDTAFRDKIVTSKRGLEGAMSDFLLSDSYWEKCVSEHRKMTPKQYNDKKVAEENQSTQGK